MILIAERDHRQAGGAELYTARLTDALMAAGHEVHHLDVHGLSKGLPQDPAARPSPLPALLAWALVCRHARAIAPAYNHVILAYGDGPPLQTPTTTIHHAPWLFSCHPSHLRALRKPTHTVRRGYTRLCHHIAGVGATGQTPARIANSEWTAQQIAGATTVLYPPLDTSPLGTPTTERTACSILSIGRISAEKAPEKSIALLTTLRAGGHPAQLALIGRAQSRFASRFIKRHRNKVGLSLYPNATFAARAMLLARTRYGYHPTAPEHFGISVGEMIAAGILPIVAPSGGVTELVPHAMLHATTPHEAAAKILALEAAGPEVRARLRAELQSGTAFVQARDFERQAHAVITSLFTSRHAA